MCLACDGYCFRDISHFLGPLWSDMSTRALLAERTDRLGTTLHMLEARNLKLTQDSSALHDTITAQQAAQDILLRERNAFASALAAAQGQVRGCMVGCVYYSHFGLYLQIMFTCLGQYFSAPVFLERFSIRSTG